MSINDKKRILFILGQFYPEGGVAVLRHLRYIKYLISKGQEVLVLAPDKESFEYQDLSLKRHIPSKVKIFGYRYHNSFFGEGGNILPIPGVLKKRVNAFLRTFPPDKDFFGWFFALFKCAVNVMNEYAPKVIYSSSCPYGVHLVSLLIGKIFRIPWIADFRDEWSYNPFRNYTKIRAWIDRNMERQVLKHAKFIIVTTDTYKEQFIHIGPEIKNKVFVIPNGYFREDFAEPLTFRNNRFTISYVGSFYSYQQPSTLIKALDLICNKGVINEKDIRFRVYGLWNQQPDNLPPYVEALGTVTHEEALHAIRSSDVNYLVVTGERGSGNVPGKIWEYLASGRPLIAEIPVPGEAFKILHDLGYPSKIVNCGDQEALCEAILSSFKEWQNESRSYSILPENLYYYENNNLARIFASLLAKA